MSQGFKKVKEDFGCEKCGAEVAGDGYTNHCSKCLWSKHVDVTPGDRAAQCGGLMEPKVVKLEGGEFIIEHVCVRCGYIKPNKAAKNDELGDYLTDMVK
ncbi:MAG: RNHCP domain-containing protein [Candidatus Vogelbacteria bacterium]|nr:RNHCP domain-containing protein [Candidatus Vogelbacteria bacterium]